MTEADEETLEQITERLQLTVKAEFVPFSQSRNAGEKHRSLNWRITLQRSGRDVVTTDYSAGIAHAPAYKRLHFPFKMSVDEARAIERETETGRHATGFAKVINPDPLDVIASLAMDSDVLEYRGFEDWAENFGYDTDSRKAESILPRLPGNRAEDARGTGRLQS